jgi:hypothetical protein
MIRILSATQGGVQRTVSLGPLLQFYNARTTIAQTATSAAGDAVMDVSEADFVWVFCEATMEAAATGVQTFSFVCSAEEGIAPRFPTVADFTVAFAGNGTTLASSGVLVDVRSTRAIKLLSVNNADAAQDSYVQAYCGDKVPRSYPV